MGAAEGGLLRHLLPANAHAVLAPRREGAMVEGQNQIRRRALECVELLLALGGQGRDGVEQRPGVGMPRLVEDLLGGAPLHHLPGVHDLHPVGKVGDNAQVVGHQDDSGVQLGFQLLEQVQHLGLDGHIQGGGGLVQQQQPGPRLGRHYPRHLWQPARA